MAYKFFSDFENDRVNTVPKGFERGAAGSGRELRNVVVPTRSQKSILVEDPDWDFQRNKDGFNVNAIDRYTTFTNKLAGKGVDIIAVACINRSDNGGPDNHFGLSVIDDAKALGGHGYKVYFTTKRLLIAGTTNNIIYEVGNATDYVGNNIPTALRLRIENVGANQEVMFKAWKYYSSPQPEGWLYRGVQNNLRGAISTVRMHVRESQRWGDFANSFFSNTTVDMVSVMELSTGNEEAATEAGGRRLVPVAKW